jgi:lipopolysaccharide transport system ATP-binding protein
MRDREWQIAVFGTFDVQNYGDLLLPIIAESELAERLGSVNLFRFSYHEKKSPDWPYDVTSLTELPNIAGSLDAALIGGGFIIRFDKEVAPGYGPPIPEIHHPTGYWLTPALIALQHGIPLIWNAPGMHCNDIPAWANPLMELAVGRSSYITVRDQPTKTSLSRFNGKISVTLLPDTAFGVSRLFDGRPSSVELNQLRADCGLTDPYIIVQPVRHLESFVRFVKNNSRALGDCRFLVLPIGPVLGDHEENLGEELPGIVRLPTWPHPLLLAELISQAAGVVGHSYHLTITALAFGIPAFTLADLSIGKYTSLSDFKTIFPVPRESDSPDSFISRLGKCRPSPAAFAARAELSRHWDHIADIVRAGATTAKPTLNRFWQSLPNLLEEASDEARRLEAEIDRKQKRIEELSKLLSLSRDEIVSRDERISSLYRSPSMRVTAPLRFIMRTLKRLVRSELAR